MGKGNRKTASGGTSTVLVVDDDPDVRAFLVAGLEEAGYRVSQAADGKAALLSFGESRPDVVVIDYLMPGMTGAEVARKMLKKAPGQKILFVSGYSETEAIERAAPGAALLTKPFRPDALDQAVRRLIDG